MKETIHQISDFIYISKATGKYKSKKDVVYHHLKYISKSATYTIGDKETILKNVDKYNKRVDSRVLLKFHIAIPRCSKDEAIEWTKRVKEFIKEQLNVRDEYTYLALHYNENNPHIHIALTPVNTEEKALRIDRKKLKEFHNNWKELLKQSNYITKKYENSIYFDRRVEYDEQARKEMKEYRELQAQIYQMKKIQKPSPAPEQPRPPEQPKPQPRPPEPKPEPLSKPSPTYSQFKPEPKPQEPKQKPEQKATNKERAIFETYSYIEGQNKNIIVVVSDIDDYISAHDVKQNEVSYIILNGAVNDFIKSMETLSSVKKELNLILMLNDKNITQKIIDSLKGIRNIGIKVGVYSANSLYDAIVNDERIVLKTIKEPKPDEPEPPEPPDEPENRGPRGPGL